MKTESNFLSDILLLLTVFTSMAAGAFMMLAISQYN